MTSTLDKTSEWVESQFLYYPCFSTFARHKQPPVSTDGNPGIEFNIILKTISAFPAARTVKKDSLAERNAEVASWWTTKPKSNNNSTSIFDENLGEDGLSTQSTYGVAFKDMYRDRVNSMSPNPKLLDPIATNDVLLKESYSTLAKAVHELKAHHS